MSLTHFAKRRSLFSLLRVSAAGPSDADRCLARQIRVAVGKLRDLPPGDLQDRVAALRTNVRHEDRVLSDDTVSDGFALVDESVRRCLGLEYYEVQFLAGMALLRGQVAEMATGEGKTLVQALAALLEKNSDFVVDQRPRTVRLTQRGLKDILGPAMSPRDHTLERPWPVYIEQALVAKYFLCRDVEYVVDKGCVVLVDQATGRVFQDRSLRQGLHQAVEAKEQLPITATRRTLARISRQQYFRLYETLCGMTGTARGAEQEFRKVYGLGVVLIPGHRPCRRVVVRTRFFSKIEAKHEAIVDQVHQRHVAGHDVKGKRSFDCQSFVG